MVAPEEPSAVAPHHQTAPDSSGSGTFGKIRQTLSTSLMTAQDKGTFYAYTRTQTARASAN